MAEVAREIEPVARALLAKRPCVVLTGCRQTGKTWLARAMLPDASYVTLDVPRIADEAERSGATWLDRLAVPCVIDEVQYAPSLFRHLKVAIDARRKQKGQYLLTGSQRFVLMQGVTESLAGRASILELMPLSLSEIEMARGERADGERLLRWAWQGGFPEIHGEDLDAAEWHGSFLATYLERDVRTLLQVRSLRDFDRFLRLLALRVGSLLEIGSLAADVGVAVNTLKAWLSVLEASGVATLVAPWHENVGKRLVKSPKPYFLDTGLLCSLLALDSPQALARSALLGAVFENLVFTEIAKSLANRGVRRPIHFYRDHGGLEVDFVVPEADRLHLVEVKYSEGAPVPPAFAKLARVVGEERILTRTVVVAVRDSYTHGGVIWRGPAGGHWPWG